jgi:S1/P1 Nuclease
MDIIATTMKRNSRRKHYRMRGIMPKTRMAATLFVLVSAANLIAWNGFGHMTVAAAAFQNLTPAARAKVTALLKLNPNYPQWVAGVAASDKDMVAFIMAATWPDAIKGMAGFTNDGEIPKGPAAGRNIGYTDKLQHRYWHFIDMPFSPDGTPLKNPVAPNAQTQIAAFRATLATVQRHGWSEVLRLGVAGAPGRRRASALARHQPVRRSSAEWGPWRE